MNIDKEYFFNFAFPGRSYTPGSVNGREFVSPVSPVLTQPGSLKTKCGEKDCTNDICKCTYIVDLPKDKVIQLTFTNLGTGSGWSHPVHLHGHTFSVMKMGFGTYDETNGRLINDTTDIMCTDLNNFCTDMRWTNSSWTGGNIPDISNDPPQKDTIVVPTGGYVVVRIVTNNPGMWFLHCHIDLHNTNGMAMVINSGQGSHPAPPVGFPRCGDFLNDGTSDDATSSSDHPSSATSSSDHPSSATSSSDHPSSATSSSDHPSSATSSSDHSSSATSSSDHPRWSVGIVSFLGVFCFALIGCAT